MHTFPHRSPLLRSAALAVGAALLGLSAVGCSSSSSESKREYAVPADLCGTPVARGALTPLLPPGKKLGQEPSAAVGVKRCRLTVDGEVALSASVEKRAAGVSAQDVAQSAQRVEPTDAAAGGGRYVYGNTGAVGRVACTKSSGAGADRSIWVTAWVADKVAAKDMLGFVEAYAASVAGTDACTEL